MRRVAAILYPAGWKAKMQPYEAITETGYADPKAVADLQGMESAMIQDAAHKLVTIQEDLNAVSAEIDRQNAFRTAVLERRKLDHVHRDDHLVLCPDRPAPERLMRTSLSRPLRSDVPAPLGQRRSPLAALPDPPSRRHRGPRPGTLRRTGQ